MDGFTDPRILGITAALASSASWALGSILFKKLGESLSPLAMTLAKGMVSIVLLGVVLCFTGVADVTLEPLLLLAASGILGIAVADSLFFEALQDLGPHALAVLMMLGMVVTPILAVLFLGESPTPLAWAGIVLVVAGIGVVLYAKLTGDEERSSLRGTILGTLSVICMAVSMIIAKKGLASISAMQATFIRMVAGTAGMLLCGIVTGRLGKWMLPFREPRLLSLFVFSVCVVTFGGFWLSLVAIKYVDVSIAYTLNSTEPLFILPLAVLILKEKVTSRAVLGTVVALSGIACLCFG
ncbi:MAG TPA: EamA family transporter [Syntrophobacteraceae bacterium]|nr:EamA family transporter [Syntrophobacteraceae bacterium]HBZ56581.1 EamA family transporter [Syntrophobacteraceae bacterium]